jgi:hypothetical protein
MTVELLKWESLYFASHSCNNNLPAYVRMGKRIYKYDWAVIQRYYDEGNGYLRCREKFGFAKDTWIKAIKCGRLVVRPRQWPLERILKDSKSRYTIKRRLLEAGLLKNAFEECGLAEWRGPPSRFRSITKMA